MGEKYKTIYDVLMHEGARITHGDKWLNYNHYKEFEVYQQKRHAKRSTLLIETESEIEAIRVLING